MNLKAVAPLRIFGVEQPVRLQRPPSAGRIGVYEVPLLGPVFQDRVDHAPGPFHLVEADAVAAVQRLAPDAPAEIQGEMKAIPTVVPGVSICEGLPQVAQVLDRTTVVRLLNEALATEIVCVLRYKRHYFMASGINAQGAAQEFLQHANEEQMHADQIAQRIVQLGGEPNFSPEGLLTRSHAEYVEGNSLVEMIREELVAERIAIDSYREMVAYLGNDDPTTRRMLETILAMEEEHADDLVSLLEEIGQ